MQDKIQFMFWDGPYRLLSTGAAGTPCGSRQGAVRILFDDIAAHESNIGYLNDIYDNVEVELQDDNMEEVTVRGHFDLRDIYVAKADSDLETVVFSYEPTGKASVGLAYTPKTYEGPEPNFQEALEDLNAEVKRRSRECRQQERQEG